MHKWTDYIVVTAEGGVVWWMIDQEKELLWKEAPFILKSRTPKSAANIISEEFVGIKTTGNVYTFPPFCKILVPSCKRCSMGRRFGGNLFGLGGL